VASTQTLCGRGALPDATLVVLDEAHHYVAAQWGQLAARYAAAIRLGLTATPERSDGKPLGELFDSIVVGATPRELTEQGFLVPCDVFAPSRYRPGLIAGDPVRSYLEHAPGRRAFIFAATVEHAGELAVGFNRAGVPAAVVSAATSDEERAAAVEAFRRGEVLALCNVGIFTEGTDVPEAEACVLARGCSSAGTYLQMVGRVLRPEPGKLRAILLDLPGVSRRFGLPSDDREYSLSGKRGIVWTRPGRGRRGVRRPQQIEAALTRVSVDVPDQRRKRDFLREMYRQAEARGYRSGWAVYRFKQQFGHLPWERPGAAA
jgi:superfamily II DNA or RNA helicase